MKERKRLEPLRHVMNNLKQAVNGLPDGKTDMKPTKLQEFWGLVKSFTVALLIAMIFRTFAYEPFHIPSGSMKPGLLVGDYIFVSKFSYGYSRYSFPFGPPLFEGRVLWTSPKRGDVVVFKLPSDPSTNYIKRLIGLPGDRIQVKESELYINGEKVKREYAGTFTDNTAYGERDIPEYKETMADGVSYITLDQTPEGLADNTQVYIVPENHYFFMGDNRDGSTDSRFLDKVGFVPRENLVGRAEIILWPDGFLHIWKLFTPINGEKR